MADALRADVAACLQGKKQGLKLTGQDLVKRIPKDTSELPDGIIEELHDSITSLELSESAILSRLPADACKLVKLIELLAHGNRLRELPDDIDSLQRLRTLLVNSNQLQALPASIGRLQGLQTLNISQNLLAELPSSFTALKDLTYLNASHNRFADFPPALTSMTKLSTLVLSHNQLEALPPGIGVLQSLTTLQLEHNQLLALPAALAECSRLKTVNLEENPYADKKICKVVKEGRIKNILTHLKKFGSKDPGATPAAAAPKQPAIVYPFQLLPADDDLVVFVEPDVKEIRPHIACAVVKGITFTPASYQAFLTLQTTLHQTLCDKRASAAIGTHDLSHLALPLIYTARPPADISFTPLRRDVDQEAAAEGEVADAGGAEKLGGPVRGSELKGYFAEDQTMLKYLSTIEGRKKWAVLLDDNREVLSLPPVINGEYSRMDAGTQDVLIEVTAPCDSSIDLVKQVLLQLLESLTALAAEAEQQLQVVPVRVAGMNGHTRLMFPPRS